MAIKSQEPSSTQSWSRLLPWVALIFSLAVTWVVWSLSTSAASQNRKDYFDFRVREAISHIKERMQAYEQVLLGARGIYEASISVERNEFRDYVAALRLADTYPGIQGVGFSLIVPAAEKGRHVAAIRKEGFPDYNIYPEGKRDPYTSIIYLEPFSGRNLRAFSYDMYSEPVRRAAMERARDTGEAAMSGKVRLVQEDGKQEQAGFLIYIPVYRNGKPHGSLAERRANIIGWVYSPFRMNDLMKGMQGEHAGDLVVEIYDGMEMNEGVLMYDSAAGKHEHVKEHDLQVHAANTIEIAGHSWTVHIHGQQGLDERVVQNRPRLVASIGLVASLLVTWLVWLLVTGRERAVATAQKMNRELIEAKASLSGALDEALQAELFLRESQQKYERLVEDIGGKFVIFSHKLTGELLYVSNGIEPVFGITKEMILGKNWSDAVNWIPGSVERVQAMLAELIEGKKIFLHHEMVFIHPDDRERTIQVSEHVTLDESGQAVGFSGIVEDITERKQLERELRQSEEKFHTLFDSNRDALMLLDENGFLDCNVAALEMFGCPTKEEFCSKHPADLSPPVQDCGTDSLILANQNIAVAMEKGSNFFEWIHRRVDTGETFPADVLLTRMELGGRHILQATVRNTAERKRIEQILRESEERWSFALEGSGDGVWDWDIQTGKITLSKAGTAMFGYEEGEAGDNMSFWYARLHPNDVSRWDEMLRNFFHSKADKFSLEYRVCCKDGSYKWILTRGMVASRSPDGRVLRMIGVHTDTHQRKLAEEHLALFRHVFDASDRAIGIADGDGKMIYANPALGRMHGYSPEELIGKPFPMFLTEDSYEKVQEFMQATIRGEHWNGLLHMRRKDGSGFTSSNSIGAILDEQGGHRYLFNIFYDYTPELSRQEELRLARDRAEAANRSKSEFLSNMSHEIRTPMNAIIGLTNLCLQTELTAKQSDYLEKVHNSAKSLLGIINDILDFSKIEAGKLDMEEIPFELEVVLDSFMTIISVKAEEKNVELLLDVSLGIPPDLVGDPLRLGQVLINLAGNAIKFTGKGEVLVRVELEEESAEHAVLRFTIADTGIGMTEEQVGRLFQAFTQADATTTRKFGGTGLGLSISKRLVEMMGGRIWVESTLGQGSTFVFNARFGKPAKPVRRRSLHGPDLRGMKALAVDDNEHSLHILKTYLESSGFDVITANNGAEALRIAREAEAVGKPCDMVVTDWKMPGMDGIELARKLRESTGPGKAPKILLISSHGQGEMLRYLDGGIVDGFLPKPFQQSQLLDAAMTLFSGVSTGLKIARQALLDPALIAEISGACLLLVEDNEINQLVACDLLERAGVAVVVAENGKEALEQLQEQKFDGVLMDMQMPVMDGLTATREIRRLPQFSVLPIIAMTANAMGEDREACLEAGMNDHIAKPIDPAQMMATLAKWITPVRHKAQPALVQVEVSGKETLPDLPGVKVAQSVLSMGGNVSVYYMILEKFHTNQQATIAGIRAALAAGDSMTAARLAHTLKGLAGTIGAEALHDKSKELEYCIGKEEKSRIDPLLLEVEAELGKLFAAIDAALALRNTGSGEEEMDAPVDLEELAVLIRSAKAQLEEFDSSVAETVGRMRKVVRGDAAMKKSLEVIAGFISKYDYERGLSELTDWAGKLGILWE